MIHEEGDFEINTGADGKPVQLFQSRRDVVFETEFYDVVFETEFYIELGVVST